MTSSDEELGLSHSRVAWLSRASDNPFRAGGVLVLMTRRYAKKHRAHVNAMGSGRIVDVFLHNPACKMQLVGAHLTPVPAHLMGTEGYDYGTA